MTLGQTWCLRGCKARTAPGPGEQHGPHLARAVLPMPRFQTCSPRMPVKTPGGWPPACDGFYGPGHGPLPTALLSASLCVRRSWGGAAGGLGLPSPSPMGRGPRSWHQVGVMVSLTAARGWVHGCGNPLQPLPVVLPGHPRAVRVQDLEA